MEDYDDAFYRDRKAKTEASVRVVLDLLLTIVPNPTSVVDLGCGVGAWLAALKERGASRVLGLDGPWVNRDYLAIEQGEFQQQDFTSPIHIESRFDLAISLEVAEHLPSDQADKFVRNLVSLSDFVLFSAAPPLQGGTNHVNEQPVEYWVEKFGRHEYVGIDCVRPRIWSDARVLPWYRQNVILFTCSSRVDELTLPTGLLQPNGDLHPELFHHNLEDALKRLGEADTVSGALNLLRKALKRKIKAVVVSR